MHRDYHLLSQFHPFGYSSDVYPRSVLVVGFCRCLRLRLHVCVRLCVSTKYIG